MKCTCHRTGGGRTPRVNAPPRYEQNHDDQPTEGRSGGRAVRRPADKAPSRVESSRGAAPSVEGRARMIRPAIRATQVTSNGDRRVPGSAGDMSRAARRGGTDIPNESAPAHRRGYKPDHRRGYKPDQEDRASHSDVRKPRRV